MKRPRQLHVEVEPEHTAEFLVALDAALSNGWARAIDVEEQASPLLRPLIACYRCDARAPRPAATLGLSRDFYNRFVVANVSRTDRSSTSIEVDDWNGVVASFHDDCLARTSHASAAFGMWSDTVNLEDLMSPAAFDLLKAASIEQNPFLRDETLWWRFLIALHHEKHSLTAELLGLWLDEQSWYKSLIEDRVKEFVFALKLLAFFRDSPHDA
jgi:hypothetical protein